MDNNAFSLLLQICGLLGVGYLRHQIQQQFDSLNWRIALYTQEKIFEPSDLQTQNLNRKFIFLSGKLDCLEPLKDQAIIKETRIYHSYEGAKKLIRDTVEMVPRFSINDKKTLTEVWNNSFVNYKLAFKPIKDPSFESFEQNFGKRLVNLIVQRLSQIKITKPHFGFPIGRYITTHGVKVGDYCTVYGQVQQKGGVQVLQNVTHILRDKQQLISILRQKLRGRFKLKLFINLVFLFLLYTFGKNLMQFLRILFQNYKKRKHDLLRSFDTLILDRKSTYDCQVCLTYPRDVILKPCKHLSICHKCLPDIKNKKCPICRTEFNDHIDIFFT